MIYAAIVIAAIIVSVISIRIALSKQKARLTEAHEAKLNKLYLEAFMLGWTDASTSPGHVYQCYTKIFVDPQKD